MGHGRTHAAASSSRRGCTCWPQCKLLLLDGQRQLQRRGALLECVLLLLRFLRIAVRAWSVTASGASWRSLTARGACSAAVSGGVLAADAENVGWIIDSSSTDHRYPSDTYTHTYADTDTRTRKDVHHERNCGAIRKHTRNE